MIQSKTITPEEEKKLLAEWWDSVDFIGDEYNDGEVPPLEDEEDDEGRALITLVESRMSTEELLEELRKREPDNPF